MTKATYRRGSLFWAYGYRGIRVHCDRTAWSQVAGLFAEAEMKVHILSKRESERANFKWCKSYETSKLAPNNILLPARPHLLSSPNSHKLKTMYLEALFKNKN